MSAQKPARRAILSLGTSVLLSMLAGCAAHHATSSPATPISEAPKDNSDEQEDLRVPYVKVSDPLFLAYDNTSNVYEKVTLTKLWVLVAREEPDEDYRRARMKAANDALARSVEAARAQTDPCTAGVIQALERARMTKNNVEQRYLQVSANAGEESEQAKLLDAQVHLMRDEIVSLTALSKPCTKQRMFH